MSTKTENRRPHTVYLRDEIWEALDRRHLEARLSSSVPPSKIEFIEQVLQAGMEALAASTTNLSSTEEPAQDVQETTAAPAISDSEADEPPLSGSSQRDEQVTLDTSRPTTPPPRRQAGARRSSALERLVQASEPGRPAPINSAATPENQVTEEQQ
jgi:hypothetical protein